MEIIPELVFWEYKEEIIICGGGGPLKGGPSYTRYNQRILFWLSFGLLFDISRHSWTKFT